MNAVQELQDRLSRIIYKISDVASLRQIELAVGGLFPSEGKTLPSVEAPWGKAVLKIKQLPTFQEEVKRQGNKKLTFTELYPCIDEADEAYDIYDLLAALN